MPAAGLHPNSLHGRLLRLKMPMPCGLLLLICCLSLHLHRDLAVMSGRLCDSFLQDLSLIHRHTSCPLLTEHVHRCGVTFVFFVVVVCFFGPVWFFGFACFLFLGCCFALSFVCTRTGLFGLRNGPRSV